MKLMSPLFHYPVHKNAEVPGIAVLDSITKLEPWHEGCVAIAASHGGVYAAHLAAMATVRGVILNNAGIGKDAAGIGGLGYLDTLGVAAAAVDHMSSRIGDGADMAGHGRISHVNERAAALGCRIGESAIGAAVKMLAAAPAESAPPKIGEARFVIREGAGMPTIMGFDSVSLLTSDDVDCIAITGSHGALLAGRPDSGVRIALRGITFSDAGVGKDAAGISRLRLLDTIGMPAATASAASARIGDARSIFETGVISHVNERAQQLRILPGDSIQDFTGRLTEIARFGG